MLFIFAKKLLYKHISLQYVQNGCSENFNRINQKTLMAESFCSKTFLVKSQLFWYCCIRVRKSISMQTFEFADLKNIEGVLTILLETLNLNLLNICKFVSRFGHQFEIDHTYYFSYRETVFSEILKLTATLICYLLNIIKN